MAVVDPQAGRPALERDVQPSVGMGREQFFRFCQRNRDVRIERDAEGSISVMAPAGGGTGARSGLLFAALYRWA